MIEGLVFSGEIENIRPTAGAIGKAVRIDDALGRYIEYAKASIPRDSRWKVCGGGWTARMGPPTNHACVLRELGAEVIVYGNQPDGMNINKDCGSIASEEMCRRVRGAIRRNWDRP